MSNAVIWCSVIHTYIHGELVSHIRTNAKVRNAQTSSHIKRTDYEFILCSCTVKCKFPEEKWLWWWKQPEKWICPRNLCHVTWVFMLHMILVLNLQFSCFFSHNMVTQFPTNIIIWGSFSYMNKKGFLYRHYLLNCVSFRYSFPLLFLCSLRFV